MADKNERTLLGVKLDNGTRITHGKGGNIKQPLPYAPVVMHELYTGHDEGEDLVFGGQFGYIEFETDFRLPRHVHMIQDEKTNEYRLLPERILVLAGVGITELGGDYYVVGPGSLVDIPTGVPHTWTACPAGIELPDGTVSNGHFTMVYNYSEVTSFFTTKQTERLESGDQYIPFKGDIEEIRFPDFSKEEVIEHARLVWENEIIQDLKLAQF